MTRPVAIVPAAGAAERFGSAKMLANVEGAPMLERTVRALLDGGVDRVVVVLGMGADRIHAAVAILHDPRITTVTNEQPERGMFSSLQAGAAKANGDPILVLPGDMPWVEPATVATLLDAYAKDNAILSPRYGGKRGHPIVIPGRYRQEILEAGPGATLHDVLQAGGSRRMDIEVYDRGVVRDVDVPSDLGGAP